MLLKIPLATEEWFMTVLEGEERREWEWENEREWEWEREEREWE